MLTLLSLAFASPADDARAAFAEMPPHTAYYDKRSTGKPVLEVAVAGPREGIVRAFSPEGTFVIAVDEAAIYTRLGPEQCARIDARTIFQQARFAALADGEDSGPPGSQLIYRITQDRSVEMASSFTHDGDPPLFSWHGDLDDSDVTVEVLKKKGWLARSPTSSWRLDREGRLVEMTVGDDALVFKTVAEGEPERARSVCPETTDAALGSQLTAQLRLVAAIPLQIELAESWSTLPEERRALAKQRQTDWWRLYFEDELPAWIAGLQGGDWQQVLLEGLADAERYAAFVEELPEDERDTAIQRWQQLWFAEFGSQMVQAHAEDVRASLMEPLQEFDADWSPDVQQELLVGPLENALRAEAERPLQALLGPVLTAGVADLPGQ
jgi:hypothetical protein